MTSPSKRGNVNTLSPDIGGGSPADALGALDESIADLTPPEPSGEGEDGEQDTPRPKRKYTRRKKPALPAPPPEPISPAMVDAYGEAAAGVCRVGFRLAGRMVGGAPEVWEITDQERSELAKSFGPLLALHHEKVAPVLPYAEPVLLLYAMYSQRAEVAARQVKEARAQLELGGAE